MIILDVIALGNFRYIGATGTGAIVQTISDIMNLEKGEYLSLDCHDWLSSMVIDRSDSGLETGQITLAGEKIWRWRYAGIEIYELSQLWPLPAAQLARLGGSAALFPTDEGGKMYDASVAECLQYTQARAAMLQSGLNELKAACNEAEIELWPSLGKTSLVNAMQSSALFAGQLTEHRISDGHWRHSRRAYYGGRTECYRAGITPPVIATDRNSSYPAEYSRPYPAGKMRAILDSSAAQHCFCHGVLGAYQVTVNVPAGVIAPLPVRRDSHLYFPTGRIDGVYTLADLETALSVDCDITFHQAWIWEESAPLLAPFIERFRHIRTWSIGKWAKLFLNSLSGKIGAGNETDIVSIVGQGELKRGWIPRDSDARIWTRKIYAPPRLSSPIIAAYITAYARQELFRIMNGSSGLCYVDTDSVYAEKLPDYLPVSDRIGDWKIEHEGARMNIYAPKHYDILTEKRTIQKGNKFIDNVKKGNTVDKWCGNRIRIPNGLTRAPRMEEIFNA